MKRGPIQAGQSCQHGAALRGVLVGLALLVLAGTGWIWYQRQAVPPIVADAAAPAVATADRAAPAASAASEPAIRHPVEAADAASQAAPADLAQAIGALVGSPAGRSMLQLADFPRRLVATVDNLGRAHAPPSIWPLTPAPGRFATSAPKGDASKIAQTNSARYDSMVQLIESIDVGRAATLYRSVYPQLQEAYRQLGYPDGYFNDRFVAVVDLLLATPEVATPIEVRLTEVRGPLPSIRPWVRYEFVDPRLEALTAGQKILLRVGPDHRRRLKAKLIAVRAALTNPIGRKP